MSKQHPLFTLLTGRRRCLDVLNQYKNDMLGPAGYVRFSRNWTFPTGRNYDRNAA